MIAVVDEPEDGLDSALLGAPGPGLTDRHGTAELLDISQQWAVLDRLDTRICTEAAVTAEFVAAIAAPGVCGR